MSKPTLFFHIGTPKTASSSIQASLALNKEFIGKKGIYVDIGEAGRRFSQIPHEIVGKFANNELLMVKRGGYNPDKVFEEEMRKFHKGGYSSMLLTYECFFRQCILLYADRMQRWIKNKFSQFDIKIVCYLRRQDFFIESWYNQSLRGGDYYKVPNKWHYKILKRVTSADYSFSNPDKRTPFDYYTINTFQYTKYNEIIKQLAEVFGKENILIRPFEKCQLPNGPIYDFYANVLNFSEKDISMLEHSNVMNQSLSRDVVEFISSCGINDISFFSHVDAALGYKNRSNVYFSNEERKRFLSFHEEGNASLAREYLGREDGKLFYEEIKEYEPYSGLSLEKAIEIRDKIVELHELKAGHYYLNSPVRKTIERKNVSTLKEVLDSAREVYYCCTDEQLVRKFITNLLDTYIGGGRPIVIYGRYGDLSRCVLSEAIEYSKSVNIFLSDRKLDAERVYPMQAIQYEDIKELNPSAIIIAAATSGKEIRASLEKLNLEDTVIYPAYDFSDEAWYRFTAPLTTPDGYVNPYWEERCDD